MSFIAVENVTKQYSVNGPKILDNISLTIDKGEFVTLVGSSGCGKTTLLRCIAGLNDISSGKIYIDAKDCTTLTAGERNIGMVFQQYSLFPNMTAAQNVAFGLRMQHVDKNIIREKTREMLDIVQLGDKGDSYPSQLSGGQQQRVALARAIITEPTVLLLDEPLSAIDAKVRKMLQEEIRRIQRKFNITTIFVTHDQHEAMVMSDKIFLMDRGIIEQEGSPDQVYTHPVSFFAATFIGDNNVLDAASFAAVSGGNILEKYAVLRPEIIHLYKERGDIQEDCAVKAVVEDVIINGTTIRYLLNGNGVSLNVSVLYSASLQFRIGEELYAAFRREDCVFLER